MQNAQLFQPAPKLYVFDRAWRVRHYAFERLRERMIEVRGWWYDKVEGLINSASTRSWFTKYWIYFSVVFVLLGGIIQCFGMIVAGALVLGIFTLFLLAWAGVCYLIIGILSISTVLSAKYRSAFYCCPHCHKSMAIPVFLCPKCPLEHTRLQPSRYGILWHRCNGCGTKLPTLDSLGRDELKRKCAYPDCGRPLDKVIGKGSNIHIPIVGGTSVGKTTYMVMALDAFICTFRTKFGFTFSFPDPLHEMSFEGNVQRLAAGRELAVTTELIPHAYNLIFKKPVSLLRPKNFVPKLLYIYDAAGEIFKTNDQMDLQDYYDYTKGILFIIDPFAIPAFNLMHREDIERIRHTLRPSSTDIMETYERLKEKIEKVFGLSQNRKYSIPIAIVVNKVDTLNLEDEVGEEVAMALKALEASIPTVEDAISILVRNFLCKYELNNFVRDLELYFSNVKYFSCSALGRLPMQADTTSFKPIRVLEPLAWLIEQV